MNVIADISGGLLILAGNQSLPWSDLLIAIFAERWVWSGSTDYDSISLSNNDALPWSEALIARYEERWHWTPLSRNRLLPWSESFLRKFETNWDWSALTENPSLPWSELLVAVFENLWVWTSAELPERPCMSDSAHLPWSESLIERYVSRWDWEQLSENRSLPWSLSLISRFKDQWEWDSLGSNYGIVWTEKMFETFDSYWKGRIWYRLSYRGASWSQAFLASHELLWNWDELSERKDLPWTPELIKRFEQRWNWRNLRLNDALPWSDALYLQFKEKWDEVDSTTCDEYDIVFAHDIYNEKSIFHHGDVSLSRFNLSRIEIASVIQWVIDNPSPENIEKYQRSRSAEISKEWLNNPISVEEAERKHLVLDKRLGPVAIPFGFCHGLWQKRILNELKSGDELWEYSSHADSWEHWAGRAGIALVRNGEIVDCFTTVMN
ncbi:MAG: hypothetical protein JW384_01462 [Nitrosomonadaceae bacterium]|nr:hypothetical protein [Nitrosomonadaceae bacterium]